MVELSIVLVILGLLIGGVLSGQALVHAVQLRAISNEMNQYVTDFGTGIYVGADCSSDIWNDVADYNLASTQGGCWMAFNVL